jgi:polyketide synthase PksN
MIDQELLHDLTESYLKALISEVSDSLSPDFDSLAAFGELGINSFQVLKIIKKLEADFGTLPKSLLFSNFNINDLANYFADKHTATLAARFAERLQGAGAPAADRQPQPPAVREEAKPPAVVRERVIPQPAPIRPQAAPIRIRETDAYSHPELQALVEDLSTRYRIESGVSRGTRKIAPNLFIGSERRGFFNYGRNKDLVVVYSYTGPRDYAPVLLEEMYRYCTSKGLQLNILAVDDIPSIGGTPFSATPFGVLQRIMNLQQFTLEGGPMRRLRYLVSKFHKSGACRTEEYRCGSNAETERQIAEVIEQWCESRTVVNPLVYDVKAEILAGALTSGHRIFLTWLDDVLQNVILIAGMNAEENGYLMDLEFYRPDMPLGGLEFAISEIIRILIAEGSDVLSLGGTYGCKLEPSPSADPAIDKILDELREQNIFNDEGNLQFKNKFRPENKSILLCRPVGSGNPDNVIDVIMMIADPVRTQTPDVEAEPVSAPQRPVATVAEEPAARRVAGPEATPVSGGEPMAIDGEGRSRILSDAGFNPLNISHEHVDFDLKTDSWSQLEMPAIQAQMQHLRGRLQQPLDVDDSLRAVFPFAHFVLTGSGQAAEHIFFKAWPRQGIVPQNLLFPSTIFHQIDKGFTPKELPHPELFDLNSEEPYKGNMAWGALEAFVAQDPAAIPFVCIEVSNNAAGGSFVSIQNLRDVKALLAEHSIPLVLDATRVVENARFVLERESEYAGRSVWEVVREIVSFADVVIGSLTKDFCVNKGGIIATNDAELFGRLQDVVAGEGAGVDVIDSKLIAISLRSRKHIESKVLQRMEAVRMMWQALRDHKLPVVQPAGGHCILIDVRQIEEFRSFKDPVASFLAWMYVNTGIRAGAHSVGMQKGTSINDLVRLAIPVGLKREEIDSVIERLGQAFDTRVNIPEVVLESSSPKGSVYAKYKLLRYHNVAQPAVAKNDEAQDARPPAVASPPAQPSPSEVVGAGYATERAESLPAAGNAKPRRTIDVAVVGMAGRYPKAKDPRELWANLAIGRDCIEEMPADRHERRLQYGSATKYRGGFIDEIDRFDSLFFNISPREAELMDPQERLFLEVAWEAIEDAGYYPEILGREDGTRKIGVYVGAVWAMYQMLGVEEKHAGHKVSPNSFLWSIANRVSYALNLSGPSMAVDTACSSSLTALYLAFKAIQAGECSAAIVGGVNIDLHQARFDINHQGGALSPDGICRTFGKGANGYVMGEGVGAIFLKPLDQAEQDGDTIYGVIKSAVVNHGGRTSGYSVPTPKAQGELITEALEEAGIDARSIGYVEAHGTGTALGDPVEITGLSDAFQAYGVENRSCAIGSVKSNIGHLEAAAGVVGVSKVLLQMQRRQLAPSLHSAEANEFIDFEQSPFYVVQRLEEWKAKEVDGVRLPLRAGVSSFGAGGSNAHIILESYEPAPQASDEPARAGQHIFPLSARNEGELRDAAMRLATFLQQSDSALADVAYTLQQGRKSFEQRLAIIAGTKEELIEKLSGFTAGKRSQDVVAGHAKGGEGVTRLLNRREKLEFVRMLSQGADPQKLAGLWTEGLLADWHGSQAQSGAKRVPLPTYPFADRRHWVAGPSPVRATFQPAEGVHPMVDSNESTFERQLFKKTFHDRDFFIYDHHVSDIPTLPGVAYLELARKAGELAAGRPVRKIRNILWISPIAVESSIPKEVFIELKPKGETVQFEVFSEDAAGKKTPHSQGTLLYATAQDTAAEPQFIDLAAIRGRCEKVADGGTAYPLFRSFGLNLGPSFQVLRDVCKTESGETLGALKLPEFREADLQNLVLHPSLVDGSLQSGMAAHLGGPAGEMLVPFSIGEVEILHPLQANCYSYTTRAEDTGKGKASAVAKSNVLIVDEAGKVLVRILGSVGVPLREVHKEAVPDADADGVSRLYYSYDWEKAPLAAENAAPNAPRSLVLFDTDETLRDLYRARVTAAGANAGQVVLVRPGESFADLGNQTYTVNPAAKDDFARLFETLLESGSPVENVCFAWTARDAVHDEQQLPASLERGVYAFLFLCQALVAKKLESAVQLFHLYSGKPGEVQPHNEAMNGFVNTVHLEHPRLLCKALEIRHESEGQEAVCDAMLAELQARTQDATVIRYQGQERFVRKLKPFELEAAPDVPSPGHGIRENGVYLITGGAGGLGLIFAEFLAKEHKAKVVLTGRSALSAELETRLAGLREGGAEVLYVPADVSSHEGVRNLIQESKARFGGINGVIHSAGVLRDSLIRNKTPEEMRAVFAPKVYGTLHLDELTKDEDLDFFVTFSSLAAVAGNGGQCDYSFANHYMDSFAAEREQLRAKGARAGKTFSLNWSLWAGGGMKLDEQTELYFRKTLGILPLTAATGLDAFVSGLASNRSQFAVMEGIREKIELAWNPKKKAAAPAAAPSLPSAGQAAPVAAVDGGDLVALLQRDLSQIVVDLLKVSSSDVAPDKILLDLGFDSIGLTGYANAVNDKYQLDITPVLFFDYPSVEEIAKYLASERRDEILQFYRDSGAPSTSDTAPPAAQQHAQTAGTESHQALTFGGGKGWDPSALDRETTSPSAGRDLSTEHRFIQEPIAIVGMSGVMPQSEDLDEFWKNLETSTDMITLIPEDRFKWEDYYGDPLKEVNKTNSKWGGFMKEVDKFDPLFFGMSPREAGMMDPQQRVFLQTVWKAIEDSGQKVSDLSGTKTGLFVGVATNDYADILRESDAALDGYTASGNSHSVLANRVSFLLNLRGPSAPIDTACSSSLVALHRAIESIHTGSSDMAIVGGVQVNLSPGAFISFGSAGMLSPDGKCKTFDKSANGYVRGEGSGAIFIKKLRDAEAAGNHIYAVIKATAENHGGKVTTLTAPNSVAQAELLIDVYEKAQIDPTTVGYIECHGTGTPLGDPIEIQALSKAFSELYKKHGKPPATTPHCGLSSVKTNIGHLETAAGIASLIKALLAIKHELIPATIHFEELNPFINLKGTPFYIVDKPTPWKAPVGGDGTPGPLRVGVSSFGFGGANAHIVLEQYTPKPRLSPAAVDQPRLVVLSGKNEARLEAYVQSIQTFLRKGDVDLDDLAYTLQVGRDEMPERLALVVSSTEELKRKVEEILSGARPEGSYRDRASKGAKSPGADGTEAETLVQASIERKDLSRLAELWVSGAKIDWRLLYKFGLPRRISAPTYPFARERHWIPQGTASITAVATVQDAQSAPRLHPLVHRNISTLKEQKFASRFVGTEFYFADHRMKTEPVLPGVAYIEMIAAAGALSGEQQVRVIRNVVWLNPLTTGNGAREVEVSLSAGKGDLDVVVRSQDDAGKSVTHCQAKLAYTGAASEPEAFSIADIQARCSEELVPGWELYPFLATSELNLGKSFQVVQEIHGGRSECLTVLKLPEHLEAEAGGFRMHPCLLDGAVHSAVGMVKRSKPAMPWSVPYTVGEVQIFGSLQDVHYSHAAWNAEGLKEDSGLTKIQIHLLDRDGRVLVRLKDFVAKAFRPAAMQANARDVVAQAGSIPVQREEAALRSLLPVWDRVRPASSHPAPAESSRLLLLGGDGIALDWVRTSYPGAQRLEAGAIAGKLGELPFDELLWIAPDAGASDERDGGIIDRQEEGVLAVFRIIKALLQQGYGTKSLRWTLVISRTQQVTGLEAMQPAHAGIVGLVGSLAKEYPHWELRLLDLDSLESVSARECLSLPWNKQGDVLARRQGEWFQQGLALAAVLPEATPAYRQNGVYVVIGGAGGVGEVWSRFMIEHHQANIVWIGRRESDAAIEQKIEALAQLGPAPLYVAADATDAAALEQAAKTILNTYPAIHGVVHSAIVLHDQSIARMDESTFLASLRAKVDVSVNMDRVFGNEELDFMLFFSSIISFVKSPGQSNYSAGCTFKDSFAHELQRRHAYPVKIMNWGYWGGVGIVADESYKKMMAQVGIGSIEAQEGMASLQALLGSDIHQLVLVKTLNSQAMAGLNLSHVIAYSPETSAAMLPEVQQTLAARPSGDALTSLEAELPTPEMIELVTEILASSLMAAGLFHDGAHRIAELSLEKQPAPHYERWVSSSIRYLQQQNVLGDDLTVIRKVRTLTELWSEWETKRALWGTNPSLQAQIALLEACLKALPAIVTGRQRATDVMFPGSSMSLVEGVYRGNALADHFNAVLRDTLIACIEQQLAAEPARRIRIIEIGAGTGGTTAALLPALRPYPVEEYCYTDVSKAFLMHAEKQFRPLFPALTTALFDVSKPLAGQSIAAGQYDFAIAANVLHATPDIRETLRNTKATLKNQGVLLLNEVSAWSLFNHLTFGLLEGWWLHEDTALRMPGSPGLAPETWRELLEAEGFVSVIHPAEDGHRFGQQIVAASSNGWTRQRIVKQVPAQQALRAPTQQDRREDSTDVKAPKGAAMKDDRAAARMPQAAEVTPLMSHDHIRKIVTQNLAESLRMDASTIRSDAPFADYGVDSIIGVNLVRTISEALHIELETTSLFEYSTVDQLAEYIATNWQQEIAAQLAPLQSAPPPAARPRDEARYEVRQPVESRFAGGELFAEVPDVRHEADPGRAGVEPIAIIGMSGRFAESETLDAFWDNLAQGKNLIKEVTRWPAEDCVMSEAPGQSYCSHGSFLDSADQFDPAFFGISSQEATYMDPQQRLFLEESWRALEDAGYASRGGQEKQCGVYVGCGTSNYTDLFVKEPPPQAWWGNSHSVVPARIAYHLDLQGPAIAVDTACSSTLVAIHLACQGLWSRETEMALAGGVYVQATSAFHKVANRAGMLTPDGKCYSFDARANGFAPGEAVGAIVLKRLSDALRDGDHIHGVIAGTGINQDGTSNGLIAPSAKAQERLERSVYERFDINPETIQMVEAHGTATIMGDSIEYLAISRAFRGYTDKKQFCAIGSVKTNLGHAGNAAGIAGIMKVLLSLKHRQIPPSLNFEKGSPAIDFESSPFFVNTELSEWRAEGDGKRRAALSGFGFSGTNAHLVIEEPPSIAPTTDEAPGYVVVLSARTAEQLNVQARDLVAMLRRNPAVSMTDLSYSLFVGRTHLAHRLSCLARNQQELIELLSRWAETGAASHVYTSEIQEGRVREQVSLKRFGNYSIQECRNATSAAGYLENLTTVAELYVQGYSLDFHALFPRDSRRIPLPTYPFARERYWVDDVPSAAPEVKAAASSRLHPFLQASTPVPGGQSYRSTLTGAELFLEDHQPATNGRVARRVLPAAACLEIARTAIEQTSDLSRESGAIELEEVVWGEPLVVAGKQEVSIALFPGDDDRTGFEISSGEGEQELIHCQGRVAAGDKAVPSPVDVDDLRRRMRGDALDAEGFYAELAKSGLQYGPAQRAVTAVQPGDGQLLAQLSVPATDSAIHPSLMSGALQAATWLMARVAPGSVAISPQAAERVRTLSRCSGEMFVWARAAGKAAEDEAIALDVDLIDARGNVCVQVRGLSFPMGEAATVSAEHRAWLFSTEQHPSTTAGGVVYAGSMSATEKMALFLRQETAVHLQKALEEVPTDRSYFDLGMSSLGMANLVQNTCRLLDENLSPSVLFEHSDIQSLAMYLATAYPARVDAVTVVRNGEGQAHAGERLQVCVAPLTPLPRRKPASERTAPPPPTEASATAAETEMSIEQLLERVSWHETSLDDGYEKVTL